MHHNHERALARTGLASLGIAVALAATVVAAAPASAATALTMYGGNAFGTSAHVGNYATSGQTSAAYVCTSHAPVRRGNTTSAIDIPQVGHIGKVTTTIKTLRTASGPVTQTTTQTAGADLFSQVHFTAVKTVSRVAHTSHGYSRTGQTSFLGLTIAGHPTPPAQPSVDQTVTLPGLAKIVFNHQVRTSRFGNYAMSVFGMTVTIPANNSAHLPAGKITIGRGTAALHRPTQGNARGWAFGTQVHAAGAAHSGRTAVVYVPCGGTAGDTKRNHVAGTSVPKALTTGTDSSTSRTYDHAGRTVVRTTSSTSRLNLFGGVIKAKAIDVAARASGNRSAVKTRSTTASIAGLTINGQSRSGSAPKNTKIAIPNVGTLWLNRVTRTRYGIQVRGLDLVLSVTKNGFKRGSEIVVGTAFASLLPQ